MAYFDKDMVVEINDDGLFEFEPQAGGMFTGHMQLVYAGKYQTRYIQLRKQGIVHGKRPMSQSC